MKHRLALLLAGLLCALSAHAAPLTTKALKPFFGNFGGTLDYVVGGKVKQYPMKAAFWAYGGGTIQFSVWPVNKPASSVYFNLTRAGKFSSNSMLSGFEYMVPARGSAQLSGRTLRCPIEAYFYSTTSGQFEGVTVKYTVTAVVSPSGKNLTITHPFKLGGKSYVIRYRLKRES